MVGRARYELTAGLRSLPFGRYVIFDEPIDRVIAVIVIQALSFKSSAVHQT